MAPALIALVIFSVAQMVHAETAWKAVGPAGGDARSFAVVPGQPGHIYLGTTNGWIYESRDGGASWHHLVRIDSADDLILDHIVVDSQDPDTIYAAGWWPNRDDGGLWISHDSGHTWKESPGLHGQSIRAFIQSPSDPKALFAGTLDGVFRSNNAGATWKQISPIGDREIHNVESLAVDPLNDDVIYAGTWHLPWKTTNGGKTWTSIKRGILVDSDIFSIIVDPVRAHTVYMSACSGIYKSDNAGLRFRRIQGIPLSAERTRVLKQDPQNHEIVYAGTTQGLYKTINGGRSFRRMTSTDVIVNDVYIDPRDPNHLLLATDRGGVLASKNGGVTFTASNTGISGRKVEALLVDRKNPEWMYAGVVNDKMYGGVFVSRNGGTRWTQIGHGLDGHDVFALAQAKDGTILAGTSHGIFALPADAEPSGAGKDDPPGDPVADAPTWRPMNTLANTQIKVMTKRVRGVRVNVEKKVKEPVTRLNARVRALNASDDIWVAATSLGLFTSRDKGVTWQGGPAMGASDYMSVAAHHGVLVAARPHGLVESTDGLTWMPLNTPQMLQRINRIAFSPDGTLWVGARQGVFFTPDMGKSWKWLQRLPFRDVDDLCYDPVTHKVVVSSNLSDQVYAINPKTMTWTLYQTGYNISQIRAAGRRLMAVSVADGVVAEPLRAGTESIRR